MPNRSLHGVVPALVTPFQEDERIDFNAWQVIIDTLIGAGVHGLFCGGSSGEFFALDPGERQVSLRFCRQAVAGRVPLFGNVGCITTRDTVDLARVAESVGVDVAVIVTPYYLKPTQDELAEHYIEVCRAVRIPVLAYNFPQHGGVDLAPETFAKIAARCENLVGVKDSGGKLEQAIAYRNSVPGRELAVFVGPEDMILSALAKGCVGVVAGFGNVAPRLFVDLYSAIREGRQADAERLQGLVNDLTSAVMLHTFPSTIKAAMQLAGLPAGNCRRPIGPLPPDALERLRAIVGRIGQAGYIPNQGKPVTA